MQEINRILTALIFCLLFSDAFAQINICAEGSSGAFWPIEIGVRKYYQAPSGSYVSYFNGDSLKVGEHIYFKEIEDHGSGKRKETFYREQNGNIYIYDQDKKLEFLELAGNSTPGSVWEKYDKSWRYTVVDTVSALSTPYCEYKGLLNIKAEPQGETKKNYASYFNLYYKRGVGLVGMDVNGKGYSFITIDKSKIEERSYAAIGCDDLSAEEERNKCTSAKISQFISQNFKYNGKIRKGILALRFQVTERGDVKDVSVHQSIKNAEGQIEEAVRVVKLMKFIPRKIDGSPIKTSVIIPVVF